MGNVTVIPARRQVGNTVRAKEEKPKLRVAAYCRVSTDSDEQATSYETQIEHYTNYISMNPEWVLAGIFADDGISGTNTKKREEFNRMIDECNAGNIDMIVTKSISRFARNTLDCLKYIRQLKEKNIPVFFEKENINSMDSKGEVMLVQEELVRRRVVHTSPNGKKRSYSCNHCFAQIVFCGECGEMYRRIHWNNRGVKSIVWRCISRLEGTEHACRSRTVNELLLQDITIKAINQTLGNNENLLKTLQENIAATVKQSDCASADGIDKQLEDLQRELLKKAHNKEEYDTVADEIFRLRELKEQSTSDSFAREEKLKRITDLQDFIASQDTEITEFDEKFIRRLIEKITVFENRFSVEFRSGVSVEIGGWI